MSLRNVLVAALIGSGTLSGPDNPIASLEPLGWMAGCWESRNGARLIDEQWMAPVGQVMLGMSRTTEDGQTREYEQISIREDAAGIVFRATPSGQPTTEFPAIEISDSTATFENLTHDFPQRIRYWRSADGDSLSASIQGPLDGTIAVVSFHYARATCAGS